MSSSINTNVMSINAQRNLAGTSLSLSTAMERLSSGLRVNGAKDDAAGLAIAERFREDWLNCICMPEANGSVRADAVNEMMLNCMVSHFVSQLPPIQRVFEARSQYLEHHDTDLPHAYCDLNADTPQDKSCWVAGTRWLPAPTQYTGYFSDRKIKARAHAYETAV